MRICPQCNFDDNVSENFTYRVVFVRLSFWQVHFFLVVSKMFVSLHRHSRERAGS